MSCIETPEAPAWLSKLESQREILGKAKLGHDSGAGAACNTCGTKCPGLDLHFWRKVCRSCKCHKDAHDVQNDQLSGWAQFELLGSVKPKITRPIFMKIRGIADEPVKLDWVPPNTSPDLISDYMSCLGENLAPVAGSEGAAKRREQLRRQVPAHDIRSDLCSHALTPQEQNFHKDYVARIKNSVVGVGNIVRIGTIKKGDLYSIDCEESQPIPGTKSYSLPLKISNLSDGLKYNCIPKNTTDKLLDLDNKGDVINKSAYLMDYNSSPILSKIVKDKLKMMHIESDRIISAVEHGPVYDKLFKSLKQLNVSVDSDVYLSPIKMFRLEYLANGKFKDETKGFAESQGAKLMTLSPNNIINNNKDCLNHPQKGTIFAPNGEIWSWSSTGDTLKNSPSESLVCDGYDEGIPPIPNYSTHPNIQTGDVLKSNEDMHKKYMGNHSPNKNVRIPSIAQENSDHDVLSQNMGNMALQKLNEHGEITCYRCKLPMKNGEVAVKAERAGEHATWHPQCFACVKCNQLLADLLYFFHKGEIYCARDLADVLKILRCAACDELIFSRPYTVAEGRTFHAQHFCCYHCDMLLGDKSYVPDDNTGQPICLQCYDLYHGAKCHSCNQSIGPDEQGVSWTQFHWHGTCFICTANNCKKSLLGSKFVIKNDMPFCSGMCVRNMVN